MAPKYPNKDTTKLAHVTATLLSSPNHIPTPTYGSGGKFTIHSTGIIPSTPAAVLTLIRDLSSWQEWNSFCPKGTLVTTASSSSATDLTPDTRATSDTIPPAETSTTATSQDQTNQPAPTARAEAKNETPPGLPQAGITIGDEIEMDVHMNGDGLVPGASRSRTQNILVTVLESADTHGKKAYRIAWKGLGYPNWLLRSERVIELYEMAPTAISFPATLIWCEFVCWETFGGILAPVVKATVGKTLVDRFGDYAGDLREYMTKGYTKEEIVQIKATKFMLESGSG